MCKRTWRIPFPSESSLPLPPPSRGAENAFSFPSFSSSSSASPQGCMPAQRRRRKGGGEGGAAIRSQPRLGRGPVPAHPPPYEGREAEAKPRLQQPGKSSPSLKSRLLAKGISVPTHTMLPQLCYWLLRDENFLKKYAGVRARLKARTMAPQLFEGDVRKKGSIHRLSFPLLPPGFA